MKYKEIILVILFGLLLPTLLFLAAENLHRPIKEQETPTTIETTATEPLSSEIVS